MADTPTTSDLIQRLEKGERSNELDVLIEVALFEANERDASCRPNAAGTKVIYTERTGKSQTCWAVEWTHDPADAIKRLRARGSIPEGDESRNSSNPSPNTPHHSQGKGQ
jgi:hypothetical protein